MADETNTQSQTEQHTETRKERLDRVRRQVQEAREQGKVQILSPDNGKTVEPVQPERVIEPKQFAVMPVNMSGIDGYVTVMTFRDVADYCEYAESLYESMGVEFTTPQKGKSKPVDISQTWQRSVSSKRIEDAGLYLLNPVHYFPPLICVPQSDLQNGNGTITLEKASLGVLDGQHRRGGILKAINRNASLESETIPVVILNIGVDQIEKRQQVFADINRTPRKVSKALSLAFDHNDRAAAMAMRIGQDSTRNSLIDFDKLSPLKSSCNAMSLTNLYNLIGPMSKVVDDANGRVLSEEQIADVVDAVIDHLPLMSALREGRTSFESVKKVFICYSSAVWQALGNVIAEMMDSKDADGNYRYRDNIASVVGELVERITKSGGWDLGSSRWSKVVDGTGKVGSRTEHIKNAAAVIRDYQMPIASAPSLAEQQPSSL